MLKKFVHNISESTVSLRNYEDMYKRVDKYGVVSFDIFDTLIKRDVPEPVDLFNIIGKKFGIDDFKSQRIDAEKKARLNSSNQEINLDDIYSNLSYLSNYKEIEEFECDVEINECVPNKDIVEFYDFCRKNKKIIIITDMYLPRSVIEKILKNNHFNGYQSLVISNEENAVKSDGRLFKVALKRNNLSSSEIVHIGNSMKADYLGAKKIGIASIKIPTFKKRIKKSSNYMFSDKEKHDYLMSFINNHITLLDSYTDFGYQCFGPLLYGFVNWLRKDLKEKQFKNVLFMSRDGYIMKRIYDQISDDKDIKSKYFEVSRRSLRVPTYNENMNYVDMLDILTVPNLTNPKQILDSWGLNPLLYANILQKYGFKLDTDIKRSTLYKNDQFKNFFEQIKENIFSNAADELKSLRKYLTNFKFSEKTAIVDIGWGGSMQHFLVKTLDKMGIENDIHGYYVGLTKKSVSNLYNNNLMAKGYAFDAMNKEDVDEERPFVGLFETLFLEQDGSVKKYQIKGDKVIVERYPYEYMSNGHPKKEVSYVKKIQNGAEEFSKEFNKSCTSDFIENDNETMFSNLYEVGVEPSLKDVALFGKFEFFNNDTKVYLANPKTFGYYILNIKSLRKDMYDSQWKIGFLKKMIKVKIDYRYLFNILRKATN